MKSLFIAITLLISTQSYALTCPVDSNYTSCYLQEWEAQQQVYRYEKQQEEALYLQRQQLDELQQQNLLLQQRGLTVPIEYNIPDKIK